MRSGTKELITRLPPGLQQTSGDPAHSSSSELKTTPCLTSLVSRVGRFCPLGLCVAALKYAVMRHCEGALLTFACRAQRYFGVGLPAGWRLAASRRSGNGRHVIDRLAQIGRSCVPISKTAEFRLRSSPSARSKCRSERHGHGAARAISAVCRRDCGEAPSLRRTPACRLPTKRRPRRYLLVLSKGAAWNPTTAPYRCHGLSRELRHYIALPAIGADISSERLEDPVGDATT